jgi:pyruvate dehydrogenase E2 component (dihydrolipoamide acetyltransferase)
MAYSIVMPRLGWTMEEGVFGAWLKADGERVSPGDLLFTVEGDKAIQEVETFESGILRIPPDAPQPGDTVVVGAVLGYLVQEGEELPFAAQSGQRAAAQQTAGGDRATVKESIPVQAAAADNGNGAMPAISPRARRVAGELGIDWTQLQGSGRTGRIVERDVRAAAQAVAAQADTRSAALVRATPVAQRVAQDAGINLAAVSPTGPGARIQRSDVEAAIRAQQVPAAPATAPAAAPGLPAGEYDALPVSRVRRLIAQRMVGSAHETAPVTLTTEADATALVALRGQLRRALEPRGRLVPSYNDLLIKLTAVALQQHGALNATWQEENILHWRAVHMGLAVDVEDGLVVPVVRDAQARSVGQIAAATRDLITRAQAHQLRAEEMQGGTFSITNLGMFGIDAFTPIINLPQAAILGVGRIMARPWVVDDQVVPRKVMALSLTFDHRVADGAAAARFLNLVREYIEEPSLWMFE